MKNADQMMNTTPKTFRVCVLPQCLIDEISGYILDLQDRAMCDLYIGGKIMYSPIEKISYFPRKMLLKILPGMNNMPDIVKTSILIENCIIYGKFKKMKYYYKTRNIKISINWTTLAVVNGRKKILKWLLKRCHYMMNHIGQSPFLFKDALIKGEDYADIILRYYYSNVLIEIFDFHICVEGIIKHSDKKLDVLIYYFSAYELQEKFEELSTFSHTKFTNAIFGFMFLAFKYCKDDVFNVVEFFGKHFLEGKITQDLYCDKIAKLKKKSRKMKLDDVSYYLDEIFDNVLIIEA